MGLNILNEHIVRWIMQSATYFLNLTDATNVCILNKKYHDTIKIYYLVD